MRVSLMAGAGDPYDDLPFSVLRHSAAHQLGRLLNPQRDVLSPNTGLLQDWRGLAEVFGFNRVDVENFELRENPTAHMLTAWTHRTCSARPATVGELFRAIEEIERYDILQCDTLKSAIGNLL